MYIDFIEKYKVKAKVLRRKGGKEGERIIKSVVFSSEVYAKAKREIDRKILSIQVKIKVT